MAVVESQTQRSLKPNIWLIASCVFSQRGGRIVYVLIGYCLHNILVLQVLQSEFRLVVLSNILESFNY